MNERIRELITQSRGYWNHGDFNMPKSVEFQEQDIEKFVELIVRECASIFEGVYTDQQRPERIDTRIKQHFGIEE